jgi:hypothetical protein
VSDKNKPKLKEQNRSLIYATVVINAVGFYAALHWNAIAVLDFKILLSSATAFLPIGLTAIATTLLNGVLSATMKSRLVFLRWNDPLPGCRAFSRYAAADPRIDTERLRAELGGSLPKESHEENRTWYRLLKEVESAPEVEQAHKDFLLMRDYAGLSLLFLVCFGASSFVFVEPLKVAICYFIALCGQLIVVRHVAATYGVRFVCTVLALKSAAPA